ncbi:MAG: ABC transporter permease [Candidatus Lernaella stagnicola]|nr:ABC transporter permease [Candidatus Lernaella stagnicola]
MKRTLVALFGQRRLLWSLVLLDLRKRYGASFGGFFWSVINPLLQILVYTVVFGYILAVNVGGNEGTANYGVFLFAGMLPWIAFSEAVQKSSTVILENKDLVKQVRFPVIMLPLQVLLSSFLHELIALGIFIVILVLLGQPPPLFAFGLIFIFPLQLMLTLGLAVIVAAFHVFYKDVGQFIAAVLTLWFFATPIIYPISLIPEWLQRFYYANPLTPLITTYRSVLLGNEIPNFGAFIYMCVFAFVVFILGMTLFHRLSKDFADLL